jgi:putative FmdB family regulatory protein
MPIYDFECEECGEVTEWIVDSSVIKADCPECKGKARKIFTASGEYLGNQDAGWLKTVTDVMDKNSTSPHVQTFLKNPTRANYKNWMKSEGRRPLEPGEPIRKGKPVDEAKIRKEVWQRHLDRKRIVVGR